MERSFIPVSIALLTISDTRRIEDDKSGDLLEKKVLESGHILFDRKIVKDEIFEIQEISNKWTKNPEVEIDLDDVKETEVKVEETKQEESKEPNLNVGDVDLGYTEHDKEQPKEDVAVEEVNEQPEDKK